MRGPQITLSRSHPNLVKKLFALEVPEIADGTVEIAAIAREAGHRTKIAVKSNTAGVNAKGACIGPMGQRVRNVMSELHGEKIDIVDWSDDPAELVAHALSPARVTAVEVVDLETQVRPGDRPRLPAVPRDRQGGPERPPRRPADRLADRHPLRRGRRPDQPQRVQTQASASARTSTVAVLASGVCSTSIRHVYGTPSPIAPPCETTSTVSPGWTSAASRRTAPTRSAISRPVSPPGKRASRSPSRQRW